LILYDKNKIYLDYELDLSNYWVIKTKELKFQINLYLLKLKFKI